MKVYKKGEIEESKVTFDVDKEFQKYVSNELFAKVLQDTWELKKVLLSTNQVKDLDIATGVIRTIYDTHIHCASLSTYCKVIVLSVVKRLLKEEFIVPYELFYYQMFADKLVFWFDYNNTAVCISNESDCSYFLSACEILKLEIEGANHD